MPNEWLIVTIVIQILLAISLLGILGSRRWGIWSYLMLTLIESLGAGWIYILMMGTVAPAPLQIVLILSTVVYLPLRLSRRLGSPLR